MATLNPFDLLGVDDSEDPLQLAKQLKIQPKKVAETPVTTSTKPNSKPNSKPNTQTQPGKEGKTEPNQGNRGGGGRGYGRERGSGGGSYRDSNNYGNRDISADQRASNKRDDGKPFEKRGGYDRPRGGFSNGDSREGDSDRSRRPFDRRDGTGRRSDIKREGSGQGNWGTQSDEWAPVAEEVVKSEKNLNLNAEKPSVEEVVVDKEAPKTETEEETKPEEKVKEMTLDEYEKVLEEKRKALQSLKTEGRKIDVKEFGSMQQLSNKKASDDIFVKLGSEKEKKKELAEKEERAKKSVSINEFLKPAKGGKNYSGGRGRGRGEPRGGSERINVKAPAIGDPGQFPTLGGK